MVVEISALIEINYHFLPAGRMLKCFFQRLDGPG